MANCRSPLAVGTYALLAGGQPTRARMGHPINSRFPAYPPGAPMVKKRRRCTILGPSAGGLLSQP